MANSFDPYAAQAGSYGVAPDLQFYSGVSGPSASTSSGMGSMAHNASAGTSSGGMDYYSGFSGSGGVAASGNMQSNGVGGAMIPIVGFWSAFTAAPMYEGEPPLLEGRSDTRILYRSRPAFEAQIRRRTRLQL